MAMQLLVSITNPLETQPAVMGGAHILDVKNPAEGTFGASKPSIIRQIRQQTPSHIPISATIGDLPNLPGTAALAGLGATVAGADYVKAGLYGVQTLDDAINLLMAIKQAVHHQDNSAQVIAAGYADGSKINSLDPSTLFEAAIQSKVTGVLLDIFTKTSGCLFDYIELSSLRTLILDAHEHDLIVGLAGGLDSTHVSQLVTLHPDIVGVRRAVCETIQGTLQINQHKVRLFSNHLGL